MSQICNLDINLYSNLISFTVELPESSMYKLYQFIQQSDSQICTNCLNGHVRCQIIITLYSQTYSVKYTRISWVKWSRVGIFRTAKNRQHYITDKGAALDRESATTDRPNYHLLNEPLTVPPPISIHAGHAYKVPLVPKVKSRQWRPLPDEGEKIA